MKIASQTTIDIATTYVNSFNRMSARTKKTVEGVLKEMGYTL